jgi:hypothetical protein
MVKNHYNLKNLPIYVKKFKSYINFKIQKISHDLEIIHRPKKYV